MLYLLFRISDGIVLFFFFSSRRRHTRCSRDWSSDVCSSDLVPPPKLEGEEELLLTGSEAIAHALRLADVDIVAAYPIRPYDAVMQAVAMMIANGQMDCEYNVAEGEHSQFEIVKHASAVGARSFVGS